MLPSARRHLSQTRKNESLTEEDVEQYSLGSHPALQKPFKTNARNSLIVDSYNAPSAGFIKVITLNELRTLNALSKQMVMELSEEIETIHAEQKPGETRVLIVRSAAEKAFCAGANLKERAEMSLDEANAFLNKLRSTFYRLETLPVPSISAIHGVALGGGLELALCTHLRVVSQYASMGLPEASLGIIPGAGGTHRLPTIIGKTRALELMLTTRRIGAVEALSYGLCNGIVEHEPADARNATFKQAVKLAANIALRAPLSVRAIINATRIDSGPDAEAKAYEGLIRTEDRNEALAAFREKRPAVFKGR
ncbi:MAG: hypothetical protein Q9162_003404 [Coniocarpon cinnabarinum]